MALGERLESAKALDRVAGPLARRVGRLLPAGPAKNTLSGTRLGHPVHPLLVGLPIGALSGVSILDLLASRSNGTDARGDGRARRRLLTLGLASALPAAAAGMADWSDTDGGERRVGVAHAALNAAALTLYGASWWRRRTGGGAVLATAGLALLAGGGWLGGHLVYALGVGVDTRAFESGPTEWTVVGTSNDFPLGQPVAVDVGRVSVLILRQGGDRLVALANRCTHRGGPLAEGKIEGDCVTCPWHGSRFALDGGEVRQGPATRPQPSYEVRSNHGRVEIRRTEVRSLRTNPV